MKITVLGTGTSQGVPVIACNCEVCQSVNPKDKRLRTSVLITIAGKNYVIDTGPDFRQQMLREDVQDLEAIIYTHFHKDHVAGMDDVRAFNFKAKGKAMEIWADEWVQEALKREFHYVFEAQKYPGVPRVNLNTVEEQAFSIDGNTFIPINVMHYKLPVKAYRIKDFAYVTDANYIAPEEKQKLQNLDVLILNALRREKHLSHFNLEEALELIDELQPKKAYLTHISHYMGLHDEVNQELPDNVEVAYDGLEIVL